MSETQVSSHDADGRRLEDIGFYTLSDARADTVSPDSRMVRGEVLITKRCNFRCPYCRGSGSELSLMEVKTLIDLWATDGLQNIRFSGGEPTLHPDLEEMVRYARLRGIERVAISTNGSAEWDKYLALLSAGANDFSVSLDACCASGCAQMTGVAGAFELITSNIRRLAERTYTTVGIVLTDENVASVGGTIQLAYSLGVSDIRVIPAAQQDRVLHLPVSGEAVRDLPILRYRAERFAAGERCRGLGERDSDRCALVMDDSAVCGGYHYPCIIYLREGGQPIGRVGLRMREERVEWALNHETKGDPICSRNCLDVCAEFNRRARMHQATKEAA